MLPFSGRTGRRTRAGPRERHRVQPKPYVPLEAVLPGGISQSSKIRALREGKGWTQEDLSYVSRVSKTQIGRMENATSRGGRNASIRALLAVAMALGCDSVEEVIEDWMWPEAPREPHQDMRHRAGEEI